jgi:hypothetical protein
MQEPGPYCPSFVVHVVRIVRLQAPVWFAFGTQYPVRGAPVFSLDYDAARFWQRYVCADHFSNGLVIAARRITRSVVDRQVGTCL